MTYFFSTYHTSYQLSYIYKLLDLVQDISISFKALINLIKLFKSGTRLPKSHSFPKGMNSTPWIWFGTSIACSFLPTLPVSFPLHNIPHGPMDAPVKAKPSTGYSHYSSGFGSVHSSELTFRCSGFPWTQLIHKLLDLVQD